MFQYSYFYPNINSSQDSNPKLISITNNSENTDISNLFFYQRILFKEYLQNLNDHNYKKECLPRLSQSLITSINNLYEILSIKLDLVITHKYVSHSTWWYELEPLLEDDINFFLPLLTLELSIYPKEFMQKLKIKSVVLCHSIIYNNDSTEEYKEIISDLDDNVQSMVFSCKERDIISIREQIHHELFHYYDFIHHGDLTKDDFLWEMFNPPNFIYGLTKYNVPLFNCQDKYFINSNCICSIAEDKAETYSWMVTSGFNEKNTLREGIIGKCINIKNMLYQFDKDSFWNGKCDFWERCIFYKKYIVDVFYKEYKE